MKPGRCGTFTHDYKRHGTTTLFAPLSVLEGTGSGEWLARPRHQEFLHFLRTVDRTLPPHLDLHLLVDNYGPTNMLGSEPGCGGTLDFISRHPDQRHVAESGGAVAA